MTHSLEFEFLDDAQGGHFVPVGGPIIQLRGLLARTDIGWFDVAGNKLCLVDSATKAWLDARSGSNWQASQVCP